MTSVTIPPHSVVITNHPATPYRFPTAVRCLDNFCSCLHSAPTPGAATFLYRFLQVKALMDEPTGRITPSRDKISHTKGELSHSQPSDSSSAAESYFLTHQREIKHLASGYSISIQSNVGRKKNIIKTPLIFQYYFLKNKKVQVQSLWREMFFFSLPFISLFFFVLSSKPLLNTPV